MAWEVIATAKPHDGKGPTWILKFVSKRKKTLEAPATARCPERLSALMTRCAAFDPADRPTMDAALAALRDVRDDPVAEDLKLAETPDGARFTFVVGETAVVVLEKPRGKLDQPSAELRSLEPGTVFYAETRVAAANARRDGEDQVYLKLAGEDGYVAAFDANGAPVAALRDSSLSPSELARDARRRGPEAVVEALLFSLAADDAAAAARLLAEAVGAFGAGADATPATRTRACRRVGSPARSSSARIFAEIPRFRPRRVELGGGEASKPRPGRGASKHLGRVEGRRNLGRVEGRRNTSAGPPA